MQVTDDEACDVAPSQPVGSNEANDDSENESDDVIEVDDSAEETEESSEAELGMIFFIQCQ
jgi:hypothetical protein